MKKHKLRELYDLVFNNVIFPNNSIISKKQQETHFNTYIMRDTASGLYKIGKSSDLIQREKSLKTANPNIRLVAFYIGNIEKELQKSYNSKKVEGEWFRLDQSDLNFIYSKYDFCKPSKPLIEYMK